MTTPIKNNLTRDAVLKLLSDDGIARVSTAVAKPPVEGEDYVDLTRPEEGVRKVNGTMPARYSDILPRSAVREGTWAAIVARLAQ